jgi:flagellar basal-body rod protein FlgC
MGPLSAFSTFNILGSGLTANSLWMDVIAENLANANTTVTPGGGPYRRQEVVMAAGPGGGGAGGASSFAGTLGAAMGVHVAAIVPDPSPFRVVYDPGAPGANAQGYVTLPNVNPVVEMTDLVVASQSFDANVSALSVAESTTQSALKIMQGV